MTEPDPIPERLRAHLTRELDALPLATPNPAGARYQRLSGARSGGLRRLVTAGALAGGAAVLLGAGATAAVGPPQVLHWLQADVDRLPFTAPAVSPWAEPSTEPSPHGPVVTAPHPTEAPGPERAEPTQEPGERENKPAQPQPAERDHDGAAPAPKPSATPEWEGGHPSPAPSAVPEGQGSSSAMDH